MISAIGLLGVGFPILAGAAADLWGLPAALWLYVAVPVAVLVLAVLARPLIRGA